MAMRATIKGGRKLKAFMRNAAAASRARAPVIEAGFLEPHVAALAAQLEFGNPRTSLPERPAFRLAADDALEAGKAVIVDSLRERTTDGTFTVRDDDADKAAEAMAETIRASYLTFEGPGLSERQRWRKFGSAWVRKELVGREGPKLIGHIQGRVTR